jgi:H-type lectin domain
MSTIAPLVLLSAVVPLDSILEGWTLLEGSGLRHYRHVVEFERHFSGPPVVQLGVVGVDASKDDNLRLRVRAEDITPTGFTIMVATWLNTQLWAVDVSWLAVGS